MSGYGYVEVLTTAQAAGTSQTAVGPLTLLPGQALHTIPPDDWAVGKARMIRAAGRVSNVVTAQPTFEFRVMFGATNVFTTGALLTSTTAHTNVPWYLEIMLTCRAVGATASLMGQGLITSRAFLDSGATADLVTSGHPSLLGPETAPAVGNTFNSNASQQVDLMYVLSTATAGNAIQLEQYWLLDMN